MPISSKKPYLDPAGGTDLQTYVQDDDGTKENPVCTIGGKNKTEIAEVKDTAPAGTEHGLLTRQVGEVVVDDMAEVRTAVEAIQTAVEGTLTVTGGGGGVEYTEGATDATITGHAIMWEDAGDTLTPVNVTKPLPVNIVAGSSSGVQYTEGDTDATITGTAMLVEGAGNALVVAPGTAADGLLVNLGTNNDVTVTNVSGTVSLPTGASTSANQATIIGHLDGVEGLLGTIDTDTGNIATSVATIAGAVSGTEVQADVLTVPSDPFGVNADAASASGSISAKLRQIATNGIPITGTVTVGSHAVTNAGTFAVQESGAALTALQLIDDPVAVLGTATYSEATTKGMVAGAVRRDADTSAVNADNEVAPLLVDARGALKVEVFSGETLPVSGAVTANAGTNLNTSALALETGGNLAGAATSLAIVDDWDESDRCKTNPIVGQAGVQGGSGAVSNTTQRVVLATDVALPAGTNYVGKVRVTDGTTDAEVVPLTGYNAAAVAIVDGSGNQITSFGGGTQYTEADTDASITGTAMLWEDTSDTLRAVSAAKPLPVNIISGAGSGGTAIQDAAAFTAGTTNLTPIGGYRDDTAPDTVAEGESAAVRVTEYRALHVNLRDATGAELAVGGGTQYTEDAASAANPVGNAIVVVRDDARAGGITTTDGDNVALRGTNSGELYVKHVDTIAATQSGAWSVAVGSALPAGANNIGDVDVLSLPALPAGTNNIGDVDVLSVPSDPFGANADAASATGLISAKLRFIASTGIPVTGTVTVGSHAVTNAGTFAVQENGDALTALQLIDDPVATLGTTTYTEAATKGMIVGAVRRDADTTLVDTTNELAPLQVDANGRLKVEVFSGETLPVSGTVTANAGAGTFDVSGTVTANAGANLNTSALALETGGNLAGAATSLAILDDWDETDRAKVNVIVGQAGITAGAGAVAANTPRVTHASDDPVTTALQLIDDPVATLGTTTYTETSTKGMVAGAIRRDADTSAVNTDNEVAPLLVNAIGALKVEAFSGETLPVSLASVPSHAVTNAGTFAVQVDGAALTSLQLIDDAVTTLGTDTYTEATSKGLTIGAVRRDADTTLVNTTNEFGPLQMDANGRLKVEAFSGETLPVSLAANQSVNLAQIAGTTTATGNGTASAGCPRVTIASDNTAFAVTATGSIAHDGGDSGNPLKIGYKAIAHGTNPTAVAANDRSDAYCNRAGIPWVMGGHPNIVTLEAAYTGAQTDAAIVTAAGGLKIVVTQIQMTADNANTVDVGFRVGFGTANTPTTTGVVLTHPGVAAGSGISRGDGSGIIGIGADGEDLRITSEVPTTGSIRILVAYYTIES